MLYSRSPRDAGGCRSRSCGRLPCLRSSDSSRRSNTGGLAKSARPSARGCRPRCDRTPTTSRAISIARSIRAYLAIQSDGPALQRGEWKPFADDLDAWRASTHYPQLIQNVYLVRGPQHELLRFHADTGTFVAEAWPAQLDPIKERLTAPPPTPDGRTLFFRSRSPILPSVPALIASIPVAPMAPVVQAFSAQSTAVGHLRRRRRQTGLGRHDRAADGVHGGRRLRDRDNRSRSKIVRNTMLPDPRGA